MSNAQPDYLPTIPPQKPIRDLLATHTLAHAIMVTHPNYPSSVLDYRELALLRAYVRDPADGDALLKSRDMLDAEGEEKGTRAQQKYGSLVGFVIARQALSAEEIAELRGWFEQGVDGLEEDEGVEMSGKAIE
jgi:hypothetical protein